MIRLTDVSKIYTIGGEEVRALDHATMHVDKGEFVSIIGPSGSGKSTLMNIIGCLDVADSGEYLLDGLAIEDYKEKELAAIRNRKIGFIFQSFNLIGKLTAEENSHTGEDIMRIFHELHSQGNTIVLITHDREIVAQASRRIQILDGHVKEVD